MSLELREVLGHRMTELDNTLFYGSDFLKNNNISTSSAPFISDNNIIGMPFSLSNLIDNRLKFMIPETRGIYYLFNNDVLVYIGMSRNLQNRLIGHNRNKEMDFNNVIWFSGVTFNLSLSEIFRLEKQMILRYKPFYNEAYLN